MPMAKLERSSKIRSRLLKAKAKDLPICLKRARGPCGGPALVGRSVRRPRSKKREGQDTRNRNEQSVEKSDSH